MRKLLSPSFMLWAAAAAVGAGHAASQETGPDQANTRLNVYFDCDGRHCDPAAYQAEIVWVNWVGDRQAAHVTVELSSEPSPAGGFDYQVEFTPSEGDAEMLSFRSFPADSEQIELDGLTTLLSIGFARYASRLGFREFVTLRARTPQGIDPDERLVSAQEVDDPWDLWVFTVGGNGTLNGSQRQETTRFSGNFSARRTSPTWKISFTGRGAIRLQDIERSDGSNLHVDQRDGSFTVGVTYTLADHWSLDLSSLSGKFPTANQKFRADLTPGIEYSFFPYEEATRRSLVLRYVVAITHREYEERSIFGKLRETPWEEALHMRGTMRQPWGDASATAIASHIIGDLSKHNYTLRGSLGFRLARGLNFNVSGDISWVTDQVYLSAMGITDEEALLRLRTRRSTQNKGLTFGFSYQFGSIYNNTVNNRFPGVR